jgi:hypothetical protein
VVVVSYSGKEINAKLVYYGMGLSGKTTNLEAIYEKVPETSRGKMVSMKTQSDRTLFFDLLPIDLGDVMGFKTRFLLYTVPGQVFYNATRKLVLKGADAIVFVADSERGKLDENKESLSNLRANLAEYKVNLDDLPWVIQYNKRDLPDVYTIEELERELNPGGVPYVEAVASQSRGVVETFQLVSKMLIERVTKDLKRQPTSARVTRSTTATMLSPTQAIPMPTAADKQGVTVHDFEAAAPRAPAPAAKGPAPLPPSFGREVDLPREPLPTPQPTPAPPVLKAPPKPRLSEVAARPATVEATVRAPAPPRPMAPAPAPAPAPASARVSPPPPAAPDGAGHAVVPVRLQAGQKLREIVLRIVIEENEAA